MAGTKTGLRERKKLRTRQAIVDVSTRLFLEQGYQQTSLAQIAEAADVSLSTFFNYFPSKVNIVFYSLDDVIASAHRRITERPEHETAMDAIADWLREAALPLVEQPYVEAVLRTHTISVSAPELQAEERLRVARFEDALAEAFARDLGDSADGIRARVLAAMALRGMAEAWAQFDKHANEADFHLDKALAATAAHTVHVLECGYALIAQLPSPLDA